MNPALCRLRPAYREQTTRRWPAFAVSAAIHTLACAGLAITAERPLAAKPPGPLQLTWVTSSPPATPRTQPPSPREKRAPSANKMPAKRPAITSANSAIPVPPSPPPTISAEPPNASPSAAPDAAAASPLAPQQTSQPASQPSPQPTSPPVFTAASLRTPAPASPATGRRYGEAGRVLLRVRVLPSGQPEEVVLQQSCGHDRLDAAALDAVRRWRFVPARQGEQAIAAWVVVPIQFSLQEAG
jgi:protein TonB